MARAALAALLALGGCTFTVDGIGAGGDGGGAPPDGPAADFARAPVDLAGVDFTGADLFGIDFALPPLDLAEPPDQSIAQDQAIPPDLATPPDLAPPRDLAPPPPDLAVTPILALAKMGPAQNAAPVNLTTEGTIDWAYWGSPVGDTKKVNPHRISALAGDGNYFSPDQPVFAWTDGTNTMVAANQAGTIYGKNDFTFSVVPNATTATLEVWCSQEALPTGTFTVAFDDNSAPPQTLMVPGNGASISYTEFVVTFRSATATKLDVTWSATNTGNHAIHAAALK